MDKLRLQQLSIVFAVSAGMHAAVIGNLRPVQVNSWTPPSQPTISVRTVEVSPTTTSSILERESTGANVRPVPPRSDKSSASLQAPLSFLSAFVESEFASAESLTQRPAPASDVVIPYPAGPDVPGRVSVHLTLFIDESGQIVRVKALDSDIPDRFVEAAKVSFQSALFSPGLTAGGPVKSRVKIEVTFDSSER